MSDTVENKAKELPEDDQMSYLYTKTYSCPVCVKEFTGVLIRRSKLRQIRLDRDFRTYYKTIDPNYYEVTLCTNCGYAALNNAFDRITSKQQDWIKEKVTPNYKHVEFQLPLTANDALARYKMALLFAQAINAKMSQKAIISLKMAWIYRDAKDEKSELNLLKFAYAGFKEAFSTENFPIGTMDEHTVKYLIGELARRTGDFEEASRMIGDLIISKNTPSGLKERAHDLKELIREKNSSV